MANKDIISKRALKHLAADIANLLLALDIEDDSVELLETEQQRIELRRADLVARVRRRHSEETFILHLEIQNENDAAMPLHMLRYFTDIQLAWPAEPLRQYLIYIGKARLTMADGFAAPDFHYCYHVLDMRTVDCEMLLEQDTPDALVLAILCDFRDRPVPVQDVVNYIVRRLHELLKDDERSFREYFEMLETLSENRQLQHTIDEAKQMLTQIDIEKLPSYRWGVEKGMEKGMEEGVLQEKRRLAQQLLDVLDDHTIAVKTGLPLEEISSLRHAASE